MNYIKWKTKCTLSFKCYLLSVLFISVGPFIINADTGTHGLLEHDDKQDIWPESALIEPLPVQNNGMPLSTNRQVLNKKKQSGDSSGTLTQRFFDYHVAWALEKHEDPNRTATPLIFQDSTVLWPSHNQNTGQTSERWVHTHSIGQSIFPYADFYPHNIEDNSPYFINSIDFKFIYKKQVNEYQHNGQTYPVVDTLVLQIFTNPEAYGSYLLTVGNTPDDHIRFVSPVYDREAGLADVESAALTLRIPLHEDYLGYDPANWPNEYATIAEANIDIQDMEMDIDFTAIDSLEPVPVQSGAPTFTALTYVSGKPYDTGDTLNDNSRSNPPHGSLNPFALVYYLDSGTSGLPSGNFMMDYNSAYNFYGPHPNYHGTFRIGKGFRYEPHEALGDLYAPFVNLFSFTLDMSYNISYYESYPVPGQVVLSQPSDEAEDVEVNTTLEWQDDPNSFRYELLISQDQGFTDTVLHIQDIIQESFYDMTGYELDGLTEYYWKIRGVTGDNTGMWSDTWSFTTYDIPVPERVELLSPADGLQDFPVDSKWVWQKSENAEVYHLQIDESPDFSDPVIDVTSNDTFYSGSGALDYESGYFWRVRGEAFGITGQWSMIRSFSTMEEIVPQPVELFYPEHGEIGVYLDDYLQWEGREHVDEYNIHLAEDAGFEVLIADEAVTDTFYALESKVEADKIYYWRVREVTGGDTGEWSELRHFVTGSDYSDLFADAQRSGLSVNAYPNPVKQGGKLALEYRHTRKLNITFADITGKAIPTDAEYVKAGEGYTIIINTMDMRPGVYFYNLKGDDVNAFGRIVIK